MSDNIVWPGPGEPLVGADGKKMSERYWDPLKKMAGLINSVNKAFGNQIGDSTLGTAAVLNKDDIAAASQPGVCSWVFKSPDEGEVVYLIINSPIAFKINKVSTVTISGTGSIVLAINGVVLGGGANAASTTPATVDHTSANDVPVGGALVIGFSGLSSIENVTVTLDCTTLLQSPA